MDPTPVHGVFTEIDFLGGKQLRLLQFCVLFACKLCYVWSQPAVPGLFLPFGPQG